MRQGSWGLTGVLTEAVGCSRDPTGRHKEGVKRPCLPSAVGDSWGLA